MSEHRFVELLFHGVVVLVLHQHHGSLPQARHGFMGRVGLVDPQMDLVRIRQQAGIEKGLLARIVAEFLCLLLVSRAVCGVLEFLFESCRSTHGGAAAVERSEARESKPCLIPEEDEIGLDRQALFHHPFDVVDMAVERAICEHEHAGSIELSFGLQIEQGFLDGAQRNRSIH